MALAQFLLNPFYLIKCWSPSIPHWFPNKSLFSKVQCPVISRLFFCKNALCICFAVNPAMHCYCPFTPSPFHNPVPRLPVLIQASVNSVITPFPVSIQTKYKCSRYSLSCFNQTSVSNLSLSCFDPNKIIIQQSQHFPFISKPGLFFSIFWEQWFDIVRENSKTLELFELCDVQFRGFCWFLWSYSSKTCLICLKHIKYFILHLYTKNENVWQLLIAREQHF
jgi:hypothetical protein